MNDLEVELDAFALNTFWGSRSIVAQSRANACATHPRCDRLEVGPAGTLSVSVRIEHGTGVASTGEILYPPQREASTPPPPVTQWEQ